MFILKSRDCLETLIYFSLVSLKKTSLYGPSFLSTSLSTVSCFFLRWKKKKKISTLYLFFKQKVCSLGNIPLNHCFTFHDEQNVQQFSIHSTVCFKSVTDIKLYPANTMGTAEGQVLIWDNVTILTWRGLYPPASIQLSQKPLALLRNKQSKRCKPPYLKHQFHEQ